MLRRIRDPKSVLQDRGIGWLGRSPTRVPGDSRPHHEPRTAVKWLAALISTAVLLFAWEMCFGEIDVVATYASHFAVPDLGAWDNNKDTYVVYDPGEGGLQPQLNALVNALVFAQENNVRGGNVRTVIPDAYHTVPGTTVVVDGEEIVKNPYVKLSRAQLVDLIDVDFLNNTTSVVKYADFKDGNQEMSAVCAPGTSIKFYRTNYRDISQVSEFPMHAEMILDDDKNGCFRPSTKYIKGLYACCELGRKFTLLPSTVGGSSMACYNEKELLMNAIYRNLRPTEAVRGQTELELGKLTHPILAIQMDLDDSVKAHCAHLNFESTAQFVQKFFADHIADDMITNAKSLLISYDQSDAALHMAMTDLQTHLTKRDRMVMLGDSDVSAADAWAVVQSDYFIGVLGAIPTSNIYRWRKANNLKSKLYDICEQ